MLSTFKNTFMYPFFKFWMPVLVFILPLAGSVRSQISFPYQSSFYSLKGSDAANLPSNWYYPAFDHSKWTNSRAPFWYGDGTNGTPLTDMRNKYTTLYLKSTFTAQNTNRISQIIASINYDDGFIVWINGVKVLAVNAPTSPTNTSVATENHESGTLESFFISAIDIDLAEGTNTIAIQAFNVSLTSSDFHFDLNLNAALEMPETIDTLGLSFSQPSGFYSNNFTLTISHPDKDAKIVYTLDGSNPQNSQSAFTTTNPATVVINPTSSLGRSTTPGVVVRASIASQDFKPSKPTARTFLFLDKIKTQSYPGGQWPSTNINQQVIDNNMDANVTNSASYKNLMDKALTDIPSISITTDIKNLFDPTSGIYVNASEQGIEWERECSIELFNKENSTGFNVNGGLRIRGGWSRHPNYRKHSFRLFFRSEYGNAKLKYPLFGDEGVSEFDKIDLRCAQNYGWQNSSGEHNTFLREIFTRDSQRDANQPYTRSRYYHLYLNGMYWGLYQTQERAEARFAADYLGGNSDDYDVVKVSGENYQRDIIATDGNLDAWKRVWDLCVSGFKNDYNYFLIQGKNTKGEFIKGGEVLVDIDNLIDYMINIFYSGNFDSPTGAFTGNKEPNNIYAIYNRSDNSAGFKFFIHDGEHTLSVDPVNPGIGLYENRVDIGTRTDGLKMVVSQFKYFHPQWLHFKLSENAEYRMRFADRAEKQLKGIGIFTPQACLQRFEPRVKQIEYAIIAESARWGDSYRSNAFTKDNAWLPELNKLRNEYFPYRTATLIHQLKQSKLFESIASPKIIHNGIEILDDKLKVNSVTKIEWQNPSSNGQILYTTNGSDPRLIGGNISSNAIAIENYHETELLSSTLLKARIYNNGNWSALKTLSLLMPQLDYSNFKITELHYHPADHIEVNDTSSGKAYEFIEFKNTSDQLSINLTGLKIDSAINFHFPDNYILPPHHFFVAASKPSKFFKLYAMEASGNFSNNFSNGGEEVIIQNAKNENIIHFTYDDMSPWPENPDGNGPSLVSAEPNPTGNPNNPYYWAGSYFANGSPFADDSTSILLKTENTFAVARKNNMQVFPNPTNNTITIHGNALTNSDAITIEILNLNGIKIYQSKIQTGTTLSLQRLNISPGIYLILLQQKQNVEHIKLVYEHK